jgi:Zn-dependent membrane protease YugP
MLYLPIILIIVIVIYGPQLWAGRVLARYNRQEYFSGNGMELARLLLDELGLEDVAVEENQVGDHYNPATKVVSLTNARCGRRSLTAVVVAAHEVGHAIQDHSNYLPLQARTRMVMAAAKFERIGAILIMAVPLLAVITRVPAAGFLVFLGGLATLCVPLLVHLITLPTEFDASFKRALPLLASGKYIPPEDIPATRKILLACALTYVANALAGLLNLWRWIRILRR